MAGDDVAKVYAGALFELGQENKILPRIEEELKFLTDLLKDNKDLGTYLSVPGISNDVKKSFIDKVFSGELSEIIINSLKVLIDNNRQSLIGDIYKCLVDLLDEANNRQRVKLTSSAKLEAKILEKIKTALKEKFKKDVLVDETVDESILGGIIIRIGDLIIDGSLSKDLKNIREKLLQSKVRSEVAYED